EQKEAKLRQRASRTGVTFSPEPIPGRARSTPVVTSRARGAVRPRIGSRPPHPSVGSTKKEAPGATRVAPGAKELPPLGSLRRCSSRHRRADARLLRPRGEVVRVHVVLTEVEAFALFFGRDAQAHRLLHHEEDQS